MSADFRAFTRLAFACFAFILAAPAAALLPIQMWQTASGARVYFVESRVLPILDISVDFPAPFGPIKPTISPLPTSKVTSFRATMPPKRLVIASTERTGSFMLFGILYHDIQPFQAGNVKILV